MIPATMHGTGARVLNDILTGKASNEPARPGDPYRAPVVPKVSLSCVACGRAYQADAGTPPGRCGPCHVAMVEANQAVSAASFAAAQADLQHRRSHARLVRRLLLVACGIGVALVRYEMRTQAQADLDQAEGTAVDEPAYGLVEDPFVSQARELASEMCACADARCAADVQVRFENWTRTAGDPADDMRAAAAAEVARLSTCHDRLAGR